MRLILTLMASLCIAQAAAAQSAGRFVEVPVPPPRIIEVRENGNKVDPIRPPIVSPANVIRLADPTGRAFTPGGAPADVDAAIDVLRAALPPDYLAMLMKDFGYERRGGPLTAGRTDLRESDLAHFLFDRWVFAVPGTRLAREFSCLSWGEYDVSPFLTMLTEREMNRTDGWIRGPIHDYRATSAGTQNARTAWANCAREAGERR